VRWFLIAIAALAGCEFNIGSLDPGDAGTGGDLMVGDDLAEMGDGSSDVDLMQPSDLGFVPTLTVTRGDFTGSVSLTSEGTIDWVQYGLTLATDVNRKSGATTITGSVTGVPLQYGSYAPTMTWTDGTPTTSATSHSGIYVNGTGNGFGLVLPAGNQTRTLHVYVSQDNTTSAFTAHFSDGSAPDVTKMNSVGIANATQVYTVVFRALTPSATLTISFTNVGAGGDVDLLAATLQ
jgi:hypothetical protein